jgi:hypothetical protein
MVRKLLLSIVGAFWASRNTMCVATALLISTIFQLAHNRYFPYRSSVCNWLQQLSLAVAGLIYFTGVLLKTNSVAEDDAKELGYILVVMMVSVVVAAVLSVVIQITAVVRWQDGLKAAVDYINTPQGEFDPTANAHIIGSDMLDYGTVLYTIVPFAARTQCECSAGKPFVPNIVSTHRPTITYLTHQLAHRLTHRLTC